MGAGFLLIHAKPNRSWAMILSWGLFAAGISLYVYTAETRHRENPEDRVTPTFRQMAQGMFDAALKPAEEDEQVDVPTSLGGRFLSSMLWKDTKATSKRFGWSMLLLLPA